MSNSTAIATITAAIGKLLETGVKINDDGNPDPDLTDLDVTMQPPGKARGTKTSNQINLFLYQVLPNAALRNMDFPRKVRSGETAFPPLALNLNYLLTAYGKNDDDSLSHRIIGRAMRILNDFPLIGVSDLFNTAEITGLLSGSGVTLQPEHIRITLLPLTLDELSKLWLMFQTDYRISAAYQVAVVLIESTQPVQSSLPVLKRGQDDRGAIVQSSPIPILINVQPSGSMPSATLGTNITIYGTNMDIGGIKARFSNLRLPSPIETDPLPGVSSDTIAVHLAGLGEDSGAYTTWIPGFYTVALAIRNLSQPVLVTNEVPMALAPQIAVSPLSAPAGNVLLTISCVPRVHDDQPVILLFGGSQIQVQSRTTPNDISKPTTFTFLVNNATAGSYLIRLRVDGIDSLPFILKGTPPMLDFDPQQKVTIT
jgi:hypothetical protein